jgi:RNA polymerase sigma factor (sigma-70 family)
VISTAADRAELVAFCRREHPRLVGALSLYCGDPDVAAEVAQEALARAVRDWSKVQQMRSPGAWVHRVGMNLASSWYRRRTAERRAVERAGAGLADHAPDGSDATAVRAAVAALPDRQRRVIILRFFVGVSLAEAAEALAATEQATAALTYRAVAQLRSQLRDVDLEVVRDVH